MDAWHGDRGRGRARVVGVCVRRRLREVEGYTDGWVPPASEREKRERESAARARLASWALVGLAGWLLFSLLLCPW